MGRRLVRAESAGGDTGQVVAQIREPSQSLHTQDKADSHGALALMHELVEFVLECVSTSDELAHIDMPI